MPNYNVIQDLKTRKITKISEIEKIIDCPCGRGKIKLIMMYINPNNGRLILHYDHCTYSFCSYERGIDKFTKIIIPELVLGE